METAPEGSASEAVEPVADQTIRLDWSALDEAPLAYANVSSVSVDREQAMFYVAFGTATVGPAMHEALAKSESDESPAFKVRLVGYVALNPYAMTKLLSQMQATHSSFGDHLQAEIDQMEAQKSVQ